MGYDLHITRKQNWFDEGGEDISLVEWTALVKSDPSMRLDGFAETQVGGGKTLRMNNEGLSVWTGWSQHVEGNSAWFNPGGGNVVVKNPDPEIRKKMWQLAQMLSAKVQGDEGELYGADGNPI